MLSSISVSTQQVYALVVEIRTSLAGIDTSFTYFQRPVNVEDALGRPFWFPAEFSVKALHTELRHRFRIGDGSTEVAAQRYELSNALDTEHVFVDGDPAIALVPGMRVIMAIIVERTSDYSQPCPRPRCDSRTFRNVRGGGMIW